jgi:mannose-6-phosphate isomerase
MRKEMQKIFGSVAEQLLSNGLKITQKDLDRPWGGFLLIAEDQTELFASKYFPGLLLEDLSKGYRLSPKILMVAPQKKLSWQYHHRRSEVWSVIQGPVGIVRSDNDKEKSMEIHQKGAIITLNKEERHRLIGLDQWGIVAELWIHTDPEHPSDEADIIRLQDDFKRN